MTHARGRRQKAELLPHDGDVEEDESDAGDDDVEEAVQEEDVQARVDVRVSEALMKYLVVLCGAPSVPQPVFTITEKAPTFKTLL